MSTVTSLSVRALLSSAIARSGLSGRARAFSGLTPPGRALAVAAAAHAARDAVWLWVVPTDPDLETATSDVRFFLGALEAMPDAVVDRLVLPLPSHQVDPYRGLAPHFRVSSARARALHAAALGSARVIVASAQALLPRLAPPESVLATSFDLRSGVEIDPLALAEILVEGGYERQDPVDEHGEFCLRGGILDVYPAGEETPIRVEFIGDSVESIRRFDPGTQRSIETLDQFQIVPVREPDGRPEARFRDAEPASIFDYLRASRAMRVIVSEPTDVRTQIDKWSEQLQASFDDRSGEKASPGGERRPPHELMLSWTDIERAVADATTLEELAIGGDANPGTAHVASQPAQEFRGRIADWIADVRQARERGETVLFVASTHGRAERTVELLRDYDIRGLLAAQADERVEGAVLVTEGLLSRGIRLPDVKWRWV